MQAQAYSRQAQQVRSILLSIEEEIGSLLAESELAPSPAPQTEARGSYLGRLHELERLAREAYQSAMAGASAKTPRDASVGPGNDRAVGNAGPEMRFEATADPNIRAGLYGLYLG